MSHQIFKEVLPVSLLINFLINICSISDGMFVFTNESYKRSLLNQSLLQFLTDITPYYHQSKRMYVERKMNFAHLATIVRQICRAKSISYTSKIVYGGSTYQISYFIEVPEFVCSPGSEK